MNDGTVCEGCKRPVDGTSALPVRVELLRGLWEEFGELLEKAAGERLEVYRPAFMRLAVELHFAYWGTGDDALRRSTDAVVQAIAPMGGGRLPNPSATH
jgi:hypothetical protein